MISDDRDNTKKLWSFNSIVSLQKTKTKTKEN